MPRYAPLRLVRPHLLADGLRMALVLAGLVAYASWLPAPQRLILWLLGAVAAGLAETQYGLRRQVRTLAVVLACYGLAWHFMDLALVLPLSLGVLMLGAALSPLQSSAALAALLLASDAVPALGASRLAYPSLVLNLLGGAAWYAILGWSWQLFAPRRSPRQALAAVFEALAGYLECKARLFVLDDTHPWQRAQLELAIRNERVVRCLDEAWSLLSKQVEPSLQAAAAYDLQWYFFAQRIHDRACATHTPYEVLNRALFHSDVSFRIQHLIQLHAKACRKRAQALRLHFPYAGCAAGRQGLADLSRSIDWLMLQPLRVSQELHGVIRAIQRDLGVLQQQLDYQDPASFAAVPMAGSNGRPRRLWPSLSRPWLRHAARLGLVLLAGLGLAWLAPVGSSASAIVIGAVLICQLGPQAARQPWLRMRALILALLLGWATLAWAPGILGWAWVCAVGSLLLAMRQRLQGLTTGVAAWLAVLGAAPAHGMTDSLPSLLFGIGFGASLGWLGLRYGGSNPAPPSLSRLWGLALRSHARYLREEMAHYLGEPDLIAHPQSRHEALAAAAALRLALAELGPLLPVQRPIEALLRFLAYSQALLQQLSSLAGYRLALGDLAAPHGHTAHSLIERAAGCLSQGWDQLAASLTQAAMPESTSEAMAPSLILQLELRILRAEDVGLQQVQALLAELLRQLPLLRKLTQHALPALASAGKVQTREAADS